MIPVLLLALHASPDPLTPGLPVITTTNAYRIQAENVQLNVLEDGTVEVSVLEVIRNQGGKGLAKIYLPGYTTQTAGSSHHPWGVTWDKQSQPITLDRSSGTPQVTVTVPLGDQATHSLRVRYPSALSPYGYGKDQADFQFRLNGNHPADLFTMAYRYSPGSVFGLPTVKPDLGWEIGERGASIRKENFEPDDALTEIHFYWNSMKPLGAGL